MRTVLNQITVDHVDMSDFGKTQAQLRQIIEKFYPKVKFSNDMNDALIPSQQEDVEEEKYEEIRVTWRPVAEGTTVEQVEAALSKMPNACIYKVLASEPILTDGDKAWMESLSPEDKEEFLAKTKERQLILNGDTGEVIMDINGLPQYKRNAFTSDITSLRGANEHGVIDNRAKVALLQEEKVTPRINFNPQTTTHVEMANKK